MTYLNLQIAKANIKMKCKTYEDVFECFKCVALKSLLYAYTLYHNLESENIMPPCGLL